MGIRRGLGLIIVAAGLQGVAAGAALAQSVPPQFRERLQSIQQREENLIEDRAYWRDMIANEDVVFAPSSSEADTVIPWSKMYLRGYLRHITNKRAALYGLRISDEGFHEALQNVLKFSDEYKAGVARELLPKIEKQLAQVRAEFEQLMLEVARSRGTAPIDPEPADGAWHLARVIFGSDQPKSEDHFEVMKQADSAGGTVQLRYRASGSCFETFQMSWTFGRDVANVGAGMKIPVALKTELVSATCNGTRRTFVNLSKTSIERFIVADPAMQYIDYAAETHSGVTADAASSGNTTGTASDVMTINIDPAKRPSSFIVRVQSYVPGYFYVVAYIFEAGGGR